MQESADPENWKRTLGQPCIYCVIPQLLRHQFPLPNVLVFILLPAAQSKGEAVGGRSRRGGSSFYRQLNDFSPVVLNLLLVPGMLILSGWDSGALIGSSDTDQ